ncbi:glycosyltransferase family 2 protein [Halorussus halophilus]|uniref:glycosyltransferase family 2 protein n=1 Tax=Halorussus halophilus TaxID=2650975 RepID=UPI001300CF09|nr:glycosyltransferase family 2 protein [Halorussus halophilus]
MSFQVAEGGTSADTATEAVLDGVVVGIPAYNEENGIGSTVLGVKRYAEEVVVVDDGSTDRTADILEQADVTVLQHERNRGKGAAVRTLFDYAVEQECEALVLIDADGQHAPADIPTLAEPVVAEEADVVIGSRYLDPDDTDETPFYRRIGQVILDYSTSKVTGADLTDTQSGFRAFSPEAVERLSITTDGMGVECEMIDSATTEGLTITERAIKARYTDLEGQTYNPVKHGLAVLVFLARLAKRRRPFAQFTKESR